MHLRRLGFTSLAVAGLFSAVTAQSAAAQNVLYWQDFVHAGDVLPGALGTLQTMRPGLTFTAASSQTEFNTQLASGAYDLAIFGEQNNDVFSGSSAVLSTFLAGGGRIMGATWRSSPMAGFFGATRVSSNQTVISGSGALFAAF